LTTLREDSELSFAEEMARRIDDKTAGRWVAFEELEKRYASDEE